MGQITQNGEVRLDPKRDIILFDNLLDLILIAYPTISDRVICKPN